MAVTWRTNRVVASTVVLWIWLSSAVFAACTDLNMVVSLASKGFSSGGQPDAQTFEQLSSLIEQINNDDMLLVLKRTGQAGSFGNLRNFLTELKFVAQSARGQSRQPESFASDMARANAIVRLACDDAAAQSKDQSKGLQPGNLARGIGQRSQEARNLAAGLSEQVFANTYKLALLGKLLVVFIAVIAGTPLCHICAIMVRTIHRGRSLCDVPVIVEFMARDAPGSISILGRFGCRIVPQDAEAKSHMRSLCEGTYCRIKVGDRTINARAMYDAHHHVGLLFSNPLRHADLQDILAHSNVTARYDFSALQNLRARKQIFGHGPLHKT